MEKALADYQAQANKPFDHEARMKELLARQAQLNAALDRDKNETQIAPAMEENIEPEGDIVRQPALPPRYRSNSSPR
jgi:hypothetical protein